MSVEAMPVENKLTESLFAESQLNVKNKKIQSLYRVLFLMR